MSSLSAPSAVPAAIPTAVSGSRAALWLIGTAVVALAVYYFVGVDQGAVSVFGNDMHLHEFVHDARHFLGFPCH
jgi:putative cobalt transporter subunit CbtB